MLINLGRGLSHASSILSSIITPPLQADLSQKTIALLGDSLSAHNSSSNNREYLSTGYIPMLNALTGHRYNFPPENNLGIGGENSTQISARKVNLASLAQTPDLIFVLAGTNDIDTSTTETAIINNLQDIYNYITNNLGAKIIALTIPARNQYPSGASISVSNQTKLENVNNWIMAQSGNITPIDIFTSLSDGNGQPNPYYYNKEGTNNLSYVHLNPIGAKHVANILKQHFENIYGTYDIPDLAVNNLLPNNNMIGTGGDNDSSLTGDLTNGFKFSAYSAATGTLNKPTPTSQQIDINYYDWTTYDTLLYYPDDITTGYVAGDQLIAEAEIEIINGSRVEGVWLEMVDKGTSTSLYYKDLSKYKAPEFPTDPKTYFYQTPVATIQNDNTSVSIRVRAEFDSDNGNSAGVNIIVKQLRCRKI